MLSKAGTTMRRCSQQSLGQSLVEFALVLPVFMMLVFGILDGGRAILTFNDVAQSSREVARVASVTCFDTATRCDAVTSGAPVADAIDGQLAFQGNVTWTVTLHRPGDQLAAGQLQPRRHRPSHGDLDRGPRHPPHQPGLWPGQRQRHQRSRNHPMTTHGTPTQGAPTMEPIDRRDDERGQALPLFVLMLIALLAATGLVVDVGGAWAQERSQQKASDVAALAGATNEANGGTRQQIIDAATASAVANGYAGSEVQVNIPPTSGKYGPGGSGYSPNDCSNAAAYPCWVEVVITRPHTNYFAGIIGQGNWDVGARGVAVGGIVNAVVNGIAPIMFNEEAVDPDNDPGAPKVYCNPQDNKCTPNNDFPLDITQFNWTTFCIAGGNCNVNTNDAVTIIDDEGFQVEVTYGMDLGAHNQGQHTAVCHSLMDRYPVSDYPNGKDLPVAINNDNGQMVGFWTWHFDNVNTVCQGQDGMLLAGWFVEDLNFTSGMTIIAGAPTPLIGQYTAVLVE